MNSFPGRKTCATRSERNSTVTGRPPPSTENAGDAPRSAKPSSNARSPSGASTEGTGSPRRSGCRSVESEAPHGREPQRPRAARHVRHPDVRLKPKLTGTALGARRQRRHDRQRIRIEGRGHPSSCAYGKTARSRAGTSRGRGHAPGTSRPSTLHVSRDHGTPCIGRRCPSRWRRGDYGSRVVSLPRRGNQPSEPVRPRVEERDPAVDPLRPPPRGPRRAGESRPRDGAGAAPSIPRPGRKRPPKGPPS